MPFDLGVNYNMIYVIKYDWLYLGCSRIKHTKRVKKFLMLELECLKPKM